MATGVEEADVEREPGRQGRARRSTWPLAVLAAVLLIISWLLAQSFLGRDNANQAVKVTSSTIEVPSAKPAVPPAEVASAAVDQSADTAAMVPDVVGYPQARAVRAIVDTGYRAQVTLVFSTSVPSGLVASQNPGAGTELAIGDSVGVFVSKGRKAVPEVTMPSVVGLTRKQAEAKVTAAGLKPYIVYGVDAQRIGRVISQWPSPGAEVPKGNEGFIQISLK